MTKNIWIAISGFLLALIGILFSTENFIKIGWLFTWFGGILWGYGCAKDLGRSK